MTFDALLWHLNLKRMHVNLKPIKADFKKVTRSCLEPFLLDFRDRGFRISGDALLKNKKEEKRKYTTTKFMQTAAKSFYLQCHCDLAHRRIIVFIKK